MGANSELNINISEPPSIEEQQRELTEAEHGERIYIMSVKWWTDGISREVAPGGDPLHPKTEVFKYYGYGLIKCKRKDASKMEQEIWDNGGKVVASCYEDEL